MSVDKTVAVVGGALAAAVIIFGVGAGWNSLNNRIDKVDERMAKIETAIGSAPCNAILPRQIEAIEKNRKEAGEALAALSTQYDCGPREASLPSPFNDGWANAVMSTDLSTDANLATELNSVDALLKDESNASGARQ